jgi:hypothetical protein
MLPEVVKLGGYAMPIQVAWRCTGDELYTPEGSGNQVGVRERTDSHRHIDTLLHQIDIPIGEEEFEPNIWKAIDKLTCQPSEHEPPQP